LAIVGVTTIMLAGAILNGRSAQASGTDPVPQPSCDQSHPGCTVRVGDPGAPGSPGNGGGNGGSGVCHDVSGAVVPCYVPGLGFVGSGGCYYLRLDSANPPPGALMPGAWYQVTCGNAGHNVWLADGQAPGPAILAQEAMSSLRLPAVQIEVSPPAPAQQLLYVPTWVWLSEQSWQAQSATASVPGLSVTATAKPAKLVLTIDTIPVGGHPAKVSCQGRGTPWKAGMDPNRASPTCGYQFPDRGAYTLTAAVTWDISWVGGGTSGTVDPLTTTAWMDMQVQYGGALNSNGG
jgi:hypothetical protein